MTKIDLRPSGVSLHFTKCKTNTDEINDSKGVRNDDMNTVGGTIQLSGKVLDEPEEKRVEVLKASFGCLQDMFGKENFVVGVVRSDETHMQLHFDFVPYENGRPAATTMINCDRLKQYQNGVLKHLQDKYPYLNFQSDVRPLGNTEDDVDNRKALPLEDFGCPVEDVSDEPDDVEDVSDEPDDVEDVSDEPDDVEDVSDESDNREDELDEPDDVEDELDQKHDKEAGQNHPSLTEPIAYWKIAEEMTNDILLISDRQNSQKERLAAVSRLRENLARCAMDKNLDVLTAIYRDTMPTTKVNVGYDQVAASEFITMFRHLYPKPNEAVQHEEDAVSDHESSVNQADVQITEDQKMNKLKIRMAKIEDKLKDRELKDRKTWLKDREDLVEFRELCLDFRELYLEVREND